MQKTDSGRYRYSAGLSQLTTLTRIKHLAATELASSWASLPLEWMMDVGCGNGVLTAHLISKMSPPRLCILVDRDPDLLRQAIDVTRKSADALTVTSLVADMDSLPFDHVPPGCGAIVLSQVLYYSNDWMRLLDDVRALGSRGGVAVALVVRTDISCSFRFRQCVRHALAQPGHSVNSETVKRWLGQCRLPYTAATVDCPHVISIEQVPDGGDLAGWRKLLRTRDNLRTLLTLFCHHDPLDLPEDGLRAVVSLLLDRVVDSRLIFRLQDCVLGFAAGEPQTALHRC